MNDRDHSNVREIAQALPQWFTETGLEVLCKDILFQPGLVAIADDRVIGFTTFFVNQEVATIGWMGVLPSYHRKGVGAAMLEQLKQLLKKVNVTRLLVSTLGDTVDYEPYDRTRAFYRKNGFSDFQRLLHPDNPEQEEELILCTSVP